MTAAAAMRDEPIRLPGGRERRRPGRRVRLLELVYEADTAGVLATTPAWTRPADACAFSGCHEPRDRQVGPWPLCRTHADRVEASGVAS